MPRKPTNNPDTGEKLVWKSQTLLPSRKGERCQLIASSDAGRRVTVQFWDGTRAVAPRECVRKERA